MVGAQRAKARKVATIVSPKTPITNSWADATKTSGRPRRDSIFSVNTVLTDQTGKDSSFGGDLSNKRILLGWLQDAFKQNTTKEASQDKVVTFRQLFRFASSRERRLVWLGFVFALFVGAITPLSMYFNGRIADILINYESYQKSRNLSRFIYDGMVYSLISGGIGFGLVMFSWAQYYFLRVASLEITNTLRVKFISSVLRQDAAFFDTHKFGALNAQLNSNIERVSDGIGDKIGVLLRGIASFVVAMAVAFTVNWRIALSMCAVGPICALVMTSLSRLGGYPAQRSLQAIEAAGSVLQETLLNVRTVQACNGEHTMAKKFMRRLTMGRRDAVMQYICNGIFDGLFFLALYIFNAIGAYYGSQRVLAGGATGGDVIIVTNLIILGAYYLGAMSPYISSIFKARIAAATIYTQIDNVPEHIDAYSTDGQSLANTSRCEIVFDNVFFSYSLMDEKRREVLRGMSWKAEPGESIALVGHSGCGKSTCISLLTRLYEYDSGTLTVNGIDVRQLNIRSLRTSIGLVAQEPVLFGGTIFENVAFDDPNITLDRVEAACRMANAHEFIQKLEHGYDTFIGAGHVHLSGGQKQRLAIARALVRDPPILLLDEATSALDAESEILVQQALESASRGRTTVIIAHRLSTLRNVDKIVVIDQGRVVETGTHKDLSAKSDGIYAKLVQSQSFSDSPIINETDKKNESTDESEEDDSTDAISTSIDQDGKSTSSLTKIPDKDTITVKQLTESFKTRSKTKSTRFWNNSIFRIYHETNNYGKLVAAVIISSMRGLELLFYVKLIGAMFTTFSQYQSDHDVNAFNHNQYFIVYGNIIVGIFCLVTISLGHSLCGWTTENVVDMLKIRAFRNVLRQDGAFFDHPRCSGPELIRRITVDVFALKAPLDYRLFNLLNNSSAIVTLLICAFFNSWGITLIGCVVLALLSILPTYLNLRMQRRVVKGQCGDEVTKIAVEIIENVRTIQLLNKEDYFCKKYSEKLMLLRRPAITGALFEAIIFALVQSFSFLSDAFCFGAAIFMVYYQFNTPIEVYIASMNIGTASYAVLFVSTSLNDILRAKSSADSIFELIDAKPSISEGMLKDMNKGQVELDSVDFAYPTRPNHKVADGLSLNVQRGQCIALVGPSGGGKSTVISLLQRFYNPKAGSIKIDGINIEFYSLRALRQEIALVGQEPVLFSGSIYENIRLGVEHCTTLEDVVQACDMANAKTFIESFLMGYQTDVGEKSSKLSGGQKQRIAIARALIRKPKILLLDEATSALDAHSEQAVQQALSAAQCDRACIMIAHRLSSIQHADKIYFISNGRVVESGTYRELVANSQSAFAQMVTKQRLE